MKECMTERDKVMGELRRIYASLPEPTAPKKELAMTIQRECGCSLTTAYNWVRGNTMPEDSLNFEKIKEIIKRYN